MASQESVASPNWSCRGCRGMPGSRPVRIGNAASAQLQLDVFGEVADALHLARRGKLASSETGWAVQRALTVHLESIWNEPDHGIWEVRGPPQHFTHSKVMAWVAVDRAIKAAEQYGLEGPIDRWRDLRRRIHADVCAKGFDEGRGTLRSSLRLAATRREPAADPAGGLPAGQRRACPRNAGSDRQRAGRQRLGATLSHGRHRRRLTAG